MRQLDTSRFKSAMIDAAILHAERLTENDSEPVAIHSVYREKWEHAVRLLQISQRRKRRQTRLVAFIVAVTVAALAGCAWRYREKIAEFVITTFDRHFKLELNDGDKRHPSLVEEVFFPTYVLEGYELKSQKMSEFKIYVEWTKNSDYLIYTQTVIQKDVDVLDNEMGNYDIQKWDNYTVFHYTSKEQQVYTWSGKYKFCLVSSQVLTDDELKKIIDGIKMKKNN